MRTLDRLRTLPALHHRRLHLARTLHQTWGRLALAQVAALDPLRAFVAARSRGAIKPDYADLWYLYKTVQDRRPRVILEYGSGCSTLLLALALQRTGQPEQFVTLETDPHWAAQTVQALPVTVRERRHVLMSPLVPAVVRGVAGYTYAARPSTLVPDLIYLDGPGLTAAHAAIKHLCSVDLLEVEPALPVGTRLIIDGRPGQTAFLQEHLQRPWRFQHARTMERKVFTLKQGARSE